MFFFRKNHYNKPFRVKDMKPMDMFLFFKGIITPEDFLCPFSTTIDDVVCSYFFPTRDKISPYAGLGLYPFSGQPYTSPDSQGVLLIIYEEIRDPQNPLAIKRSAPNFMRMEFFWSIYPPYPFKSISCILIGESQQYPLSIENPVFGLALEIARRAQKTWTGAYQHS